MDSQKSTSNFLKKYCSLKRLFLMVALLGIFLFSISGIGYAQYQMKTPQTHSKESEAYIKVTHPDQDEVWEKGKIQKIRWKSKGIHGNVKILLTGQNVKPIEITRNTINSGLFNFVVPRNLHDGYYKIQVMKVDGSVKGESNATITIGNPKFAGVKVIPQKEQEKVIGVDKSVTQTGAASTGGAVGAKIPQGEATPSTAGATGLTKQQSGMSGTTVGQQKPSASVSSTKATSEELAAINRLCQSLGRIKSKLNLVNQSTGEFIKFGREMKQVTLKTKQEIKQASLTPLPEKRVISKKTSEGDSGKTAGLIPAEKTKGEFSGVQQMQKINGDAKRVKGNIVQQVSGIRQELKIIEADIRRLSGSSLTPAQDRRCISNAVKELEHEMASSEELNNILKAQRDEYNSQVTAQMPDDPRLCGGCNLTQCKDCCAQKNKIQALEGSPARATQEKNLALCLKDCEFHAQVCSSFSDFGSKASDLFGMMSDILKDINDRALGTSRNLI